MWKYITQRILLMFMTLFIITGICFVLIRMLPLRPGIGHEDRPLAVAAAAAAGGRSALGNCGNAARGSWL